MMINWLPLLIGLKINLCSYFGIFDVSYGQQIVTLKAFFTTPELPPR
jgi:hypothetical protein